MWEEEATPLPPTAYFREGRDTCQNLSETARAQIATLSARPLRLAFIPPLLDIRTFILYTVIMDTITSSRKWLPALSLRPGRSTPSSPRMPAGHSCSRRQRSCPLHGSVRVLDGGNQFNAYHVARSIRRFPQISSRADPHPPGARLHLLPGRDPLLRRGHSYCTCPGSGVQPAAVTLVFDLLGTFADDNVSLVERRRLLERCRLAMRQIADHSVLLVGLRPARTGHPDQDELLQIVLGWVDNLWQAEVPVTASPQH